MSDRRDRDDSTPRRFRTRRFRPLRAIAPWLFIGVGVVVAVRGAVGLGANGNPLSLLFGAGLITVGVVAFSVYRWQAKRGREER